MSELVIGETGYAAWYAGEVVTAVQQEAGGLSSAERDQLYGALYANAATRSGALLDPADANALALARIIRTSRNGGCVRCSRPLAEHDLDLAAAPWLTCPTDHREPPDRRASIGAWVLWVGLPFLSFGLLSWLPSLVAAVKSRGHGWGIATALLTVFTLSFWTQPDVDSETQMALWLGASIYGATQVKPWLRWRGRRAMSR